MTLKIECLPFSVVLFFVLIVAVLPLKQEGGQGFIQLGNWRFGIGEGGHFIFSHKVGYAFYYTTKGQGGVTDQFTLWR
jgi:hypothetical protein